MSALSITDIEPTGPDRRACRLLFDDGDPDGFILPQAVVKALGIEPGATFASRASLRAQVDAIEAECAWNRCLRILNARDKTSYELRSRLGQDGYHLKVVARTLRRLAELGLVDDERFTANYVEAGLRAKKGWPRIVKELARKGIDLDIEDLRYRPDPQEEYDAAYALVKRLPVTTEKERTRVLRRLITRGFPYATARRVLDARKAML